MGELGIFASRIKQLRESLDMTQKEFSGYIGIKQQTLSGYERGIIKPPLDIAKEIAEKCNVSIDWLCGLTDTMEINRDRDIETYSDLIRVFLEIKSLDMAPDGFEFLITNEVSGITTTNVKMRHIISDIKKMQGVSGTLGTDIYNTWIRGLLEGNNIYLPTWHSITSTTKYQTTDTPPEE